MNNDKLELLQRRINVEDSISEMHSLLNKHEYYLITCELSVKHTRNVMYFTNKHYLYVVDENNKVNDISATKDRLIQILKSEVLDSIIKDDETNNKNFTIKANLYKSISVNLTIKSWEKIDSSTYINYSKILQVL
jgi:hypothetical protein